jgi:hypothetical protein
MRPTFTVLSLLLFASIALGQQSNKPTAEAPKPETVRLEIQAQQEIAEAQRQAEEAKTALEAAIANHKAAQQLVATLVFKAMAEAKLSPKEWQIRQDPSGIYFEKVKLADNSPTTLPK